MTSHPPSTAHRTTFSDPTTAGHRVPVDTEAGWHVFLHFQLPDAATQRAFIDAYLPVVHQHVEGWAGFLGATLYASTDGTRVINHTRWIDETAYRYYLDASDSDARLRAIQAAFDRVPEVTGPEMSTTHTYASVVDIPGGAGDATPAEGGAR